MHIVQSQSLTCGAEIDKPFIYKNFFPFPFEKYIIFSPQNKIPSKDYLYFQDVINHIFPTLEQQGIKIVHFGPKDSLTYNGVINLCGRININQLAYLMDNALLFLGTDGFECHLASVSNIPIVSINSSTYANNTGPFFGEKDKQIIFESFKLTGNKKPSFNVNEFPKSINLIKPEEISKSIFKLLNINIQIPIETVFTGERYSHFTVQESLANCKNPIFAPENLVEINTDIPDFSEECLAHQLNHFKKAVVVTSKALNINLLKNFKKNIEALIYKIKPDNLNIPFLQEVRTVGIKIVLMSEMSQQDIDTAKIHYYEIGAINKLKEYPEDIINSLKNDAANLYYRSCKIFSSNGQAYYSLAAQEHGIPIQNTFEYQKVIDTPNFWNHLDFYTLVKITI